MDIAEHTGSFRCYVCGHLATGLPSTSVGEYARSHHCPSNVLDTKQAECPDCWHRWKYHGPQGSNGCGAPGCRCSEPDAVS